MDNPVSGLQWLFCPHARMVVIMQKGPLTKYEILLASWPLTVALMCAVAIFGYLNVSKGDVQRYVHAEQLRNY